MFRQALHDAVEERGRLEAACAAKRQAVAAAAADCAAALSSETNDGVRLCFEQQRRIEAAARRVRAEAEQLQAQVDGWARLVGQLGDAARQLGDFETWLEALEVDMSEVADALEALRESGGAQQRQ